MKINEGGMDRSIRVIAGVALIAAAGLGFIGPWGWIGLVPMVTGLVGFCPAYTLFGISTCPRQR